MTFDETLARVLEVLQREGRVSYRALRRRFGLDEEYLEDLKAEIIQAKKLAIDEDGAVLVWTGDTAPASVSMPTQERVPLAYTPRHLVEKFSPPGQRSPASANRLQCSSAIWRTPRPWRSVWGQKPCTPCCSTFLSWRSTKSTATRAQSINFSVTVLWRCLERQWPMRTMPGGLS